VIDEMDEWRTEWRTGRDGGNGRTLAELACSDSDCPGTGFPKIKNPKQNLDP
jgi:hypothetical protein